MDLEIIDIIINELNDDRLRKGIIGSTEEIQEKCPQYYSQVMNVIYELGTITCNHGHCKELDEIKDKAFKLINL